MRLTMIDEIKLEKQLQLVYKGHKVVQIIILCKKIHWKDKDGNKIDIQILLKLSLMKYMIEKYLKKQF